MKRNWIFIAMFFAGIVSVPQANAATISAFDQACLEASAAESSVQLTVILQRATEECSFTYEELTVLYDNGLVGIEEVAESSFRVTVLAADGNPLIAVLIETF